MHYLLFTAIRSRRPIFLFNAEIGYFLKSLKIVQTTKLDRK
jgi:hypothetical protein